MDNGAINVIRAADRLKRETPLRIHERLGNDPLVAILENAIASLTTTTSTTTAAPILSVSDEDAVEAAKSGDVARLRALLRAGAKVPDKLLLSTAILKNVNVVRAIVEEGNVDIKSVRSRNNWTPRYKCYLYGYTATENYLESIGAPFKFQ